MSQVANIDRTASDVASLVHENYVNEVKPWLDHISPLAGLFSKLGPGGYSLIGSKLVFSADHTYAGGWMGTDGYLPDSQVVDPISLETTPARLYLRRAIDNFIAAIAVKPGAFDDYMARVTEQQWNAVERGTTRHIHGSATGTVCTCAARASQTSITIKNGYGHTGTAPAMFLEPGMWVAWLDAGNSYAVGGVAKISAIAYGTSATTATVTFSGNFDDNSTTIAADDPIVFATTTSTSATHFITERNKAPLGLLDIVDPAASNATYLTVTEATYPRVKPTRRASSDFGQVEIMSFLAQIAAKSNSPVSAQSHTLTMQTGAKIELAKELLAFQQAAQLGRVLEGGWTGVRMGEFDVLDDMYHIHDVMYALCPEDIHVVDLDGEPAVWAGDGSEFLRLSDYDGKEWFLRHYIQRFASRRNRCGALTGVTNPNPELYSAHPV